MIAMIFFFPLYWAISNSLRRPAETFTVTGLGIPFVNFKPTLENWSQQFRVPEFYDAFLNSTVISFAAVAIALALGAARRLRARPLPLLHASRTRT